MVPEIEKSNRAVPQGGSLTKTPLRYRPIDVTVEAFRWTGGPDQTEDPEWAVEALERGMEGEGWPRLLIVHDPEFCMIIENKPHTQSIAKPGSYLVKGVTGELFGVKAEDFETQYEAIA